METNKNTLGKIEEFNYDTVTFHGYDEVRNPAYLFTMMLCKFIKPEIKFEYHSSSEYNPPSKYEFNLNNFNSLKLRKVFSGELPDKYDIVKKFLDRFWNNIFSNKDFADYFYKTYIFPIFRTDDNNLSNISLQYISYLIGNNKVNMVSDIMFEYIEYAVTQTIKTLCDLEVYRTLCDCDTKGLLVSHVPKNDYDFDFKKNIQLISPGTKLFVYPVEWDPKSIEESATCIEMIDTSTEMQVKLLEEMVVSGKDYSKLEMTYILKGLKDAIKIAKKCLQNE